MKALPRKAKSKCGQKITSSDYTYILNQKSISIKYLLYMSSHACKAFLTSYIRCSDFLSDSLVYQIPLMTSQFTVSVIFFFISGTYMRPNMIELNLALTQITKSDILACLTEKSI